VARRGLTRRSAPGSVATDPGAEVHFQLSYFSFITLTTVGYGDITPTGNPVRSPSVAEAVTGQFYLAVLVAELIGKRVAQAPSGNAPRPNERPNRTFGCPGREGRSGRIGVAVAASLRPDRKCRRLSKCRPLPTDIRVCPACPKEPDVRGDPPVLDGLWRRSLS